jgi:succinate dehydrogenase / fumarate reductase membrane anchor subunit
LVAGNQIGSSIDRTQGLGSAREGVGHWWAQRITAVGLIPLTLWFAASLIARAGNDYGAIIVWLRTPFTVACTVLLLIALFYHMALGLQVVAEDYLHNERVKNRAVIAIDVASIALAATGIAAALRIAVSG